MALALDVYKRQSIYHLFSRISIHLQRYFIKIRAAVHYFVQQPLSFAESSGTFSASFSFGWQCPENSKGPADAGAGCARTASRPDRLTPVYRGRPPILAESIENGDFGLN